jgi:hypothetical protein
VIKLRVVPYMVTVTQDVEPDSAEVCRLPRGTVLEAVEEKASRNGTTRVMITDPIWKGWISLRAPNGELDLEPTDAIQAEKLMARSGAAALQGPPLREPAAHAALVAELQAEFFAEDVVPPKGSASWTEDELREYFDSGGATLPAGFHIPVAEAAKLGLKPGSAAPPPAAEDPEASPAAAAPPAAGMSDEEVQDRDGGRWARGTIVVINGVSQARELNGRSGAVILYDSELGRYEVRLADRAVRLKPAVLQLHPKQRTKNAAGRGDEIVFLSEDEKMARQGMYAVKMDPQFWYDQALDRVFAATNEFEVRAGLGMRRGARPGRTVREGVSERSGEGGGNVEGWYGKAAGRGERTCSNAGGWLSWALLTAPLSRFLWCSPSFPYGRVGLIPPSLCLACAHHSRPLRRCAQVLGLETSYTEDLNTIKRAYRKVSLVVHPDKNKHPQVRYLSGGEGCLWRDQHDQKHLQVARCLTVSGKSGASWGGAADVARFPPSRCPQPPAAPRQLQTPGLALAPPSSAPIYLRAICSSSAPFGAAFRKVYGAAALSSLS